MNQPETKTTFEILYDRATSRMHSALSAYHIWKWMEIAINLNQPGGKERTNRNLAIMNRHIAFFAQLKDSMYKTFVADLWIFFDKDGYDDTFSLDKLIGATKDKLTQAQIDQMYSDIERIKREHGVSISLVQELRNAHVAHQEINAQSRYLNYARIENLFAAVQEITNLISTAHSKSVHWWGHLENEVDRQMNWIFDNLERGESARLKEIDEKYGTA